MCYHLSLVKDELQNRVEASITYFLNIQRHVPSTERKVFEINQEHPYRLEYPIFCSIKNLAWHATINALVKHVMIKVVLAQWYCDCNRRLLQTFQYLAT